MLKLSHYTGTAGMADDVRFNFQRDYPDWKPRGMWVSVDGEYDWHSWCLAEQFSVYRLAQKWNIEVDWSRILLLSGSQELTQFTEQYAGPYRGLPERVYPGVSQHHFSGIKWKDVAEKYGGIVISPYDWEQRLDYMWYYGWDCASGCLWDNTVITKVERDNSYESPTVLSDAEGQAFEQAQREQSWQRIRSFTGSGEETEKALREGGEPGA